MEILKKLEHVYFFTLGAGDAHVLEPGYGHMVFSVTLAAVRHWCCMKSVWNKHVRCLLDLDIGHSHKKVIRKRDSQNPVTGRKNHRGPGVKRCLRRSQLSILD